MSMLRELLDELTEQLGPPDVIQTTSAGYSAATRERMPNHCRSGVAGGAASYRRGPTLWPWRT